MSEWISTDDSFPTSGSEVLAYQDFGDGYGYYRILAYRKPYMCSNLTFCDWDNDMGEFYPVVKVTHWMPLPEPPEATK